MKNEEQKTRIKNEDKNKKWELRGKNKMENKKQNQEMGV